MERHSGHPGRRRERLQPELRHNGTKRSSAPTRRLTTNRSSRARAVATATEIAASDASPPSTRTWLKRMNGSPVTISATSSARWVRRSRCAHRNSAMASMRFSCSRWASCVSSISATLPPRRSRIAARLLVASARGTERHGPVRGRAPDRRRGSHGRCRDRNAPRAAVRAELRQSSDRSREPARRPGTRGLRGAHRRAARRRDGRQAR